MFLRLIYSYKNHHQVTEVSLVIMAQPGYNPNYPPQHGGYPGYGQPPSHPGYAGPPQGNYPVTRQPQPMVNNITVVTNQPGANKQSSNWQIGLFDCFNSCGTCALVFFCMPIAECIAANKINENCCYPFFFFPCGIINISVRFRTLHRIEMGMCGEGLFSLN